MAESKEELKSLLMRMKQESEKSWLKTQHSKTKITVTDFILGGSKITADCDCSHEIKRCLVFGRKAMTNLDSVLKNTDLTLSTKVHLVKGMVFSVLMYRHESWTIKKAEHQRIVASNCGVGEES